MSYSFSLDEQYRLAVECAYAENPLSIIDGFMESRMNTCYLDNIK